MDGLTPEVWFPVVTLIVGVLLKALFDALTDSRKAAVEKEVRLEKRKEAILMQRIESQRKTLEELQAAVSNLVRCASLGHINDAEAFHKTGAWAKGLLPEELNEKTRAAFREVALLKVRAHDPQLRHLVSELSSLCSRVPFALSFDDSEQTVFAAGSLFTDVNEAIGRALRSLEGEEQALLV